MVLKVGLEPTRLAAEVFETSLYTYSNIRAYKTHLGAAVSPAASPTIDLDFGRIFVGITLRPKTSLVLLDYSGQIKGRTLNHSVDFSDDTSVASAVYFSLMLSSAGAQSGT